MNPFSIKLALGVALLGALGVLARFVLVHCIARYSPSFPAGTLTVNVVGSFLIGCAFVIFSAKADASQLMKVLLVSGFLGGFTTFSSFSLELLEMYREGRVGLAILYGAASPILGFAAAGLGAFLTALRFG